MNLVKTKWKNKGLKTEWKELSTEHHLEKINCMTFGSNIWLVYIKYLNNLMLHMEDSSVWWIIGKIYDSKRPQKETIPGNYR